MGTCSACLVLAPHSQLFVCLKEDCGYSLKQKVSILSPTFFYRRECVFCGGCSFRGAHSPHSEFMKPAGPIAFNTASSEVGFKLEEEFEKFAELNDKTPVVYIMKELLGTGKLENIRAIDFLTKSRSVAEWHSRLTTLKEALEKMKGLRGQGYQFVKDLADKFLTAYSEASKKIQWDTQTKQEERKTTRRERLGEHRRNMGEEIPNESFSSVSSNHSTSSRRSDSTQATILQMSPKSRSDAQVLQAMDDEVQGGVSTSNEELVKKISKNLALEFDTTCRFSNAEAALKNAASQLEKMDIQDIDKKAIVEFMEKRFLISWPQQTK